MNKKRIQQFFWRRIVKLQRKTHDLNYFFWETTLKCNLLCRHCGSDCRKESGVEELSRDKVLSVFKNIAENYNAREIMIAVTGGEPLLRQDLFEIMTEANGYGFPWGMVTNGILVNEDTVKKCQNAGMRTVSVSIDGMEDTNDWMRNLKGAFSKSVNALKLFMKSKILSAVEVITCVHPGNIHQLDEMFSFFSELGLKNWRFFSIFPKGRALENSELVLDGKQLEQLFIFIKTKKEKNMHMNISFSEEGYLGCKWEHEVRDYFFDCKAGVSIGGLLCDGSYTACPSLSKEWIQGHVNNKIFSEVWENEYKEFRGRKWMKNEYCKGCKEWKNCEAGSLHLWDWDKMKPAVCHFRMLD